MKDMKFVTYTGTKIVQACPCSLEKAEAILGRTIHPSTGETSGYLVKYTDDYLSFSPESVFKAAYRKSETELDNLLIEKEELIKRKQLLEKQIKDASEDSKLLCRQHKAMEAYLLILEQRISNMNPNT